MFYSARAFAAFLRQRLWTSQSTRAVKRSRIEHERLQNSLTEYRLQANEDGNNTWAREEKNDICTFLAINDSSLTLWHLLRNSTMLIPLQTKFFLLPATLLRTAKQTRQPMARAGKIVCCPFHQKLPYPLLSPPLLSPRFWWWVF